MSDVPAPPDFVPTGSEVAPAALDVADVPEPSRRPAEPISSRFLFVDVAAQRAKQLRRGAKPRVETVDTRKLERVAMREVNSGYIDWSLPDFKGPQTN